MKSYLIVLKISFLVYFFIFQVDLSADELIFSKSILAVTLEGKNGVGQDSVILHNVSNKTIIIEKIILDCSCMSYQISSMKIISEGNIQLDLKVESKGLKRVEKRIISIKIKNYKDPFLIPVLVRRVS